MEQWVSSGCVMKYKRIRNVRDQRWQKEAWEIVGCFEDWQDKEQQPLWRSVKMSWEDEQHSIKLSQPLALTVLD